MELIERTTLVIATFYQFVRLPDFAEKQRPLWEHCREQGIKGTILLATEGINGTIAGSRQAVNSVLAFIRADPRLAHLEAKEFYADSAPFERLKVRLKTEIVALGLPEIDPSEQVGQYVNPQHWNELISDPDVTVIDTRNDFEVEIGTFKGAQNPHTASFREFTDYVQTHLDPAKHKKVALFCTGGIRCEKATSWMLTQGFEDVYHLKGGILNYLKEVSDAESLWQGECFVFDQRISLKHGLASGTYSLCQRCGNPISESYPKGVFCSYCFEVKKRQ